LALHASWWLILEDIVFLIFSQTFQMTRGPPKKGTSQITLVGLLSCDLTMKETKSIAIPISLQHMIEIGNWRGDFDLPFFLFTIFI
jgi:hypothetical protein